MPNTLHILPDGRQVCLVDRDQLRFKLHGRSFYRPHFLSALMGENVPTVPTTFSGSRKRQIKYPILGNSSVGDCFYASSLHQVQTWTGNVGVEVQFNEQQVISRYLQISGGDNGLDDATIFPEWKAGLVGPNGPHKILDEMTVDPHDDVAIRRGMFYFAGASWTCSLPNSWINTAAPGAIWDAGTPNRQQGHAMHLSGFVAKGDVLPYSIQGYPAGSPAPFDFYEDETWAIDSPIVLTPAGLKSADPEVIIQFSMDMFDAHGFAPHCNMYYSELAGLWKQYGGISLPPDPFGPPPGPGPVVPPPTPIPVPVPVLQKYGTLDFTGHPVPKGGRVYFIAPVAIPPIKVDLVAHPANQQGVETSGGFEVPATP